MSIPQHQFISPSQGFIDALDDCLKVIRVVDKVEVVAADRQHRGEVEIAQPLVIKGFQQGEVFGADPALNIPAAAAKAEPRPKVRAAMVLSGTPIKGTTAKS